MARKLSAPIPRVTLTPPEAAASLGVGPDLFNEDIRPRLRLIRHGRKVLIPVSELERWTEENAERPVAEEIEDSVPRPHPRTNPHRGQR